jgi:hypothetical protein
MRQGEPSEVIITKEDYWTYIEPSTYYKRPDEWDAHGGKFIVRGNEQQIVPLAQRLSQYVAQGTIRSLKYGPPVPGIYKSWALMVFCLDFKSDEVWKVLQREGVTRKIWKYEKETRMDWKPGGRLYKKFQGK